LIDLGISAGIVPMFQLLFSVGERFLAECYYVTFGLWHVPSVCRLSVTLRPAWRVELFSNILHH